MNRRINLPKYIFAILLLVSVNIVYGQQVWYVSSDVGSNANDGMSIANTSPGVGPFQTIQFAINSANDLDTIKVAEGEYFGYHQIDKSLVLLGANHQISGNGSRNAESVILPDESDITTPANSNNSLLQITTSNVTVKGFTFNGDNPNVITGNDVNGADVDYSYGVIILGDHSGISVGYNRFVNLNSGGIEALGNVNSPNRNCIFNHNATSNMGGFSYGITLGNGFYSDVVDNYLVDINNGIYVYDFTTATSRPLTISDNVVRPNNIGILLADINKSSSNVYVANNTLNAGFGLANSFQGISIRTCVGDYNLELRDNNVSNYENGVFFFLSDLPSKIIQFDTFENCNVALLSISAFNHTRDDTIKLISSLINESSQSAIEIYSDTTPTVLYSDVTKISDCTKGILAAGNVFLIPNATEFENIKPNSFYFQLSYTNGASSIINKKTIDATRCIFDGNVGSTSNPTANFSIEDGIKHYLDDESFAYVNLHDSNVYVSNVDGNSFIRRALDFADRDYHIHVANLQGSEDLFVDKQLHLSTYGDVSAASITLNASGDQLFIHDTLVLTDALQLNGGRLNTRDGFVSVGEILVKPGNMNVNAAGASYVDGPLQIVVQTTGKDTVEFPIGTSQGSRRLTVYLDNTTTGNWDEIEAMVVDGNTPDFPASNGISHVSDVQYWQVASSNIVTHDMVTYKGSYSAIGTNDEAGEASSLRLATVRDQQWWNIGGSGTADNNGTITSTMPNQLVGDVALANLKAGMNRLGKGDLVAAFDASNICQGNASDFISNSTALNGTINSYAWDFGDTATTADVSTNENPSYTYSKPGEYIVSLIVGSDAGDIDSVKRTITVYSSPVVGFSEEINCYPDICRFTDTSSVESPNNINDVSWVVDNDEYNSPSVVHAFDTTGQFDVKLIISTVFGCIDSSTKTINYGDTARISITPVGPVTICDNDSIQLTASAGLGSYEWRTGETTNSIYAKNAGTYLVTGYNGNNCFASDSIEVMTSPSPTADAGNDVVIKFGETTTLQGSGSGSYLWTPAETLDDPMSATPVASPSITTTYLLTVTNSSGCTDQDSVEVEVSVPDLILVPNILSPNGDGFNDVWDLSQIPDIENNKVTVINKWGKEVFSSTNYQHNWEGTYNGEPLPDGVYIYIIDGSQFYETLKGQIQIIR